MQPGQLGVGCGWGGRAAEVEVDVDPANELVGIVRAGASHALDDVAASALSTLASGGAQKQITVETKANIHVERRMSKNVAVLRAVVLGRFHPGIRPARFLDDALQIEAAQIGL